MGGFDTKLTRVLQDAVLNPAGWGVPAAPYFWPLTPALGPAAFVSAHESRRTLLTTDTPPRNAVTSRPLPNPGLSQSIPLCTPLPLCIRFPPLEPAMNPAARDSAPYGKACAGCSRAKCRCIPRGAGLPCERCERLQKVCQPSAVVRRRAARRPARAPSAAQLEEKLDGLAALLRAQVEGSGGTGSPGSAASGGMLIETGTSDEHQYRHSQGTETRESPESPSACYLTPQTAVSPLPQEPSPSQAEQYLRTFRENHLRMFPFVYIHPDTT